MFVVSSTRFRRAFPAVRGWPSSAFLVPFSETVGRLGWLLECTLPVMAVAWNDHGSSASEAKSEYEFAGSSRSTFLLRSPRRSI